MLSASSPPGPAAAPRLPRIPILLTPPTEQTYRLTTKAEKREKRVVRTVINRGGAKTVDFGPTVDLGGHDDADDWLRQSTLGRRWFNTLPHPSWMPTTVVHEYACHYPVLFN